MKEIEQSEPIKGIIVPREDSTNFKIKKETSTPAIYTYDLSLLSQWIIVPFLLNTSQDHVIQLPIHYKDDYLLLMKTVGIHFDTIKVIYIDDKVDEVILKGLKLESKKEFQTILFTKEKIHPVVRDFYVKSNHITPKENLFHVILNVKQFELDLTEFVNGREFSTDQDTSLWNFLQRNFLEKYGEINLAPEGWDLEDELLYSETLHYFCTFARNIYMYVNIINNKVRGLKII
ncbi:hypothetical protein [Paenibacillus tianmuensis]|nr:hypothetical protein [Paenibacillus tianmuensis]